MNTQFSAMLRKFAPQHDEHARQRPIDAFEKERAGGEQQHPRQAPAHHDQHPAAATGEIRRLSAQGEEVTARLAENHEQQTENGRVRQRNAPDVATGVGIAGTVGLRREHHRAQQQADTDQEHRYLGRHRQCIVGELDGPFVPGHGRVHGDHHQNSDTSQHHRHREPQRASQVLANGTCSRARRQVHRWGSHQPAEREAASTCGPGEDCDTVTRSEYPRMRPSGRHARAEAAG